MIARWQTPFNLFCFSSIWCIFRPNFVIKNFPIFFSNKKNNDLLAAYLLELFVFIIKRYVFQNWHHSTCLFKKFLYLQMYTFQKKRYCCSSFAKEFESVPPCKNTIDKAILIFLKNNYLEIFMENTKKY